MVARMKKIACFIALFLLSITIIYSDPLPKNFVFLKDIDPSIIQTMRYKTEHNFIGRPLVGYSAKTECVLTKPAAEALHKVQLILQKQNLSLMVYDCYRPQRAVDDFMQWSKIPAEQKMKVEFYPEVNKADFFKL